MGRCQVQLGKAAVRELKRLDRPTQAHIVAALNELRSDPRPPGVEKLGGRPPSPAFWRLRIGDYRVVYAIPKPDFVIVTVIRHRRDAYQGLKNLDAKLAHAVRQLGETSAGRTLLDRI